MTDTMDSFLIAVAKSLTILFSLTFSSFQRFIFVLTLHRHVYS